MKKTLTIMTEELAVGDRQRVGERAHPSNSWSTTEIINQ